MEEEGGRSIEHRAKQRAGCTGHRQFLATANFSNHDLPNFEILNTSSVVQNDPMAPLHQTNSSQDFCLGQQTGRCVSTPSTNAALTVPEGCGPSPWVGEGRRGSGAGPTPGGTTPLPPFPTGPGPPTAPRRTTPSSSTSMPSSWRTPTAGRSGAGRCLRPTLTEGPVRQPTGKGTPNKHFPASMSIPFGSEFFIFLCVRFVPAFVPHPGSPQPPPPIYSPPGVAGTGWCGVGGI